MRARSPIEMMVDRACGFDPDKPPPKRAEPDIALCCPSCEETLMVYGDKTDPPGTSRVETDCPKCATGEFKISYFDADGNLIETL
jgi:hypothetical protein